jgi:MFS family permease
LYVAAGLFMVSAAIATRLPRPRRTDPEPDDAESLLREFENEHRPLITISATAYTVIRFAVGAFVFGLAFALRRASEPAWMYGLAVVAYGVGAYTGNVFAPLARRRFGEDRLITGALIGLTVAVAIAAAGGSRIMVVFVAAVMGAATTFGRQGFDSMVQRHAPLALHAQAFSRFETQYQLAWVVGGAAATAIAVTARVSLALLIAILLPASALYLRRVNRARQLSLATAQAALLEPAEVARAHVMAAERWIDGPHRDLAIVEAAAAINVGEAAGWEIGEDVRTRLDNLRSAEPTAGDTEESARRLIADLRRIGGL